MPAGKDVPLKSRVTLTGLSKAELNGKKASICTRLNEGRYGVRVDGLESPIKLKPANLTATRRAQAACFLASHVASRRRLTQLRETIRCIKSQTQPAWLHLSWFSPDAELAGISAAAAEVCRHRDRRVSGCCYLLGSSPCMREPSSSLRSPMPTWLGLSRRVRVRVRVQS